MTFNRNTLALAAGYALAGWVLLNTHNQDVSLAELSANVTALSKQVAGLGTKAEIAVLRSRVVRMERSGR